MPATFRYNGRPIILDVSMSLNGDWVVVYSVYPGVRIPVTVIGNPAGREAVIERSRIALDSILAMHGIEVDSA